MKSLFKPGGLKLIFALLNNPGMEKATYRDMAKAAKVALGTVDIGISELKELGLLINMGKKGRQLLNTERLLRRWVEAYPENLRPKIVRGRFRTDTRNWWKDIEPADFGINWGGDIAVAGMTSLVAYIKKEVQLISIEKYQFFRLTFPHFFLKVSFMIYKRVNTMKNSLGNWWWLNSHPEASLPI